MTDRPEIFVFGSNLAGRHGRGAALSARLHHGAQPGISEGWTGRSYAVPTKNAYLTPLPLTTVSEYVDTFCQFAAKMAEYDFMVTAVGCGLAGMSARDVAPLFYKSSKLSNVWLPAQFALILGSDRVSFTDTGARAKLRRNDQGTLL